MNKHTTQLTVQRKGNPVTVDVEGDVQGDLVAISNVTKGGQYFLLDDNECSAARCVILNAIYPKMGYDKRAAKLLEIAAQYPGV